MKDDAWLLIDSIKTSKLGWNDTIGSSRQWWEQFEKENSDNPALVYKLATELETRNATITEFFIAYVYSNTDNIQANLHYMDYKRLKDADDTARRLQIEEAKQKK